MNPRKPFVIFAGPYSQPKKKTKMWIVQNKLTGEAVGLVKWFSRFRKYSFFPHREMIFDANCLEYITRFLEQCMKEHHDAKSKKLSR